MKSCNYDAYRNLKFYTKYSYNADGKEKRTVSYLPDGTIGSYSENEYDENGTLLKTSVYRADGTLQTSWGPATEETKETYGE